MKYVSKNLDILTVSETKVGDTFPESQFLIEGFSTSFKLDRKVKGGEFLLYIRQDLPSKYLTKITLKESFKGFFVELNLRSARMLI